MALMDLQGMETESRRGRGGSSTLSVIICRGTSTLSLLLC